MFVSAIKVVPPAPESGRRGPNGPSFGTATLNSKSVPTEGPLEAAVRWKQDGGLFRRVIKALATLVTGK